MPIAEPFTESVGAYPSGSEVSALASWNRPSGGRFGATWFGGLCDLGDHGARSRARRGGCRRNARGCCGWRSRGRSNRGAGGEDFATEAVIKGRRGLRGSGEPAGGTGEVECETRSEGRARRRL